MTTVILVEGKPLGPIAPDENQIGVKQVAFNGGAYPAVFEFDLGEIDLQSTIDFFLKASGQKND